MEMPSNEVSDIISCSICMETYEEPKALPCLHTFCKNCIAGHINKNLCTTGDIPYFNCPICRKKVHGPKGKEPERWAEYLPHNHLITSLKDSIKEDPRKLVCPSHIEKQAEFYCFDHESVICSSCLLKHRTCSEIDSLDDAVQNSLAKGKEMDLRLQSLADICRERQNKKKQLEEKSANAKDKITAWREQMFEIIQDVENTLKQQLDDELNKELDVLSKDMDECQIEINKMMSAKNEHLDASKSDRIILGGRKIVDEILLSVDDKLTVLSNDRPDIKVDFEVDMSMVNKMYDRKSFVRLIIQRKATEKSSSQHTYTKNNPTDSKLNLHAKPFIPTGSLSKRNHAPVASDQPKPLRSGYPKLMRRLNVKSDKDRRQCLITGAAFLPNGVLVLCDHDNAKIKFFNKEMELVSQMVFNSDPWDVATTGPGEIAVSFPDDSKIFVLKVENGQVVGTRANIPTEARCYGLAFNGSIMAVTCRTHQKTTVSIIDLTSNITIGSWGCPASPNGGLWYAAFSVDGSMIYVTDDDKNRIICLSLEGVPIAEIGSLALKKPRGVASLKNCMYFACKGGMSTPLQQDKFHFDGKFAFTTGNVISADPSSHRLVLAFNNGDDTDNYCNLFTVP